MFLNDAAGTLPAKPDRTAIGPNPGWWNQNPAGGAGTVLGAEWLNMLQAELKAILDASGIALDKANDGQLLLAIQALIRAGGLPTGIMTDYTGLNAPAGWIWAFGTIGNATSNAVRANADTFALFSLWFTDREDTKTPMLTSGGVPVARATYATALLAWNANCQMTVPDYRERVRVGRGNMGGASPGRITTGAGNPDPTIIGNTGGAQTHNHGGATAASNGEGTDNASTTGGGNALQTTGHTHNIAPASSLPPMGFETVIVKL